MSHRSDPNRDSSSRDVAPTWGPGVGELALVRDHRERWRRGERIPVEAFLERSHLPRVGTTALLDLIYSEVVLREEDGESPRLDEYLDRFPAHSGALRAQFEIHQALRTSGSFNITLTGTPLDLSAGGSFPPWARRASSSESQLDISTHPQTDPDVAGRAAPPVAAHP